jgi:hypothetical protein
MKYAIIKSSNGAISVDSEFSELEKAKVRFHGVAQTLWNAEDVLTAKVMIVDEQLNCVEDYREFIHHEQPEPEPTPAPETTTEE